MLLEKLIILEDVLAPNIICRFENLTGPVSLIARLQRFFDFVTVTVRRNGQRYRDRSRLSIKSSCSAKTTTYSKHT